MQFKESAALPGADLFSFDSLPDDPPEGERWSSWDGATHGPKPRPDWVITALGAVETDLGVLKTGKEADVHIVRRWIPDGTTEPAVDSFLAAKRYRTGEHRMFHRDAGYQEGRRVRRSREMRAMARRTEFGRELLSGQWAIAEFEALGTLWEMGIPVPYPVQLSDREMLMEFIGADGVAAPRLAQARPEAALLPELFEQLRSVMVVLAERGWTHGDLSPYNVLLHHDRLVVIDWPQIVDIIGNPRGFEFLERDVTNMCRWFTTRGLAVDEGELLGDLVAASTARW
ncbi:MULTISPECIES: serine protein kinase RIO [unclassified Phycicoccus]|uniref:serine protein kinase RIO n=1 Tax=unclassified Phycicoccus TaxID=2637926 RepID=UPI000702A20C|nr:MULTISPECIES: RIO1 family regulatory kinase/ATPase [unclassified Phycicoccus]KQU70827.1 RIO-like kinase [Phycicoccus sp. Root101]KQZ89117.1 RIO-like kinase [Phycicoccus sp. Root563]